MRAFRILGAALAALPCVAAAQGTFDVARQLTTKDAPFRALVALECNFDQRCVDGAVCQDAAFFPRISGEAGGLSPSDMVLEATMIDDAHATTLLGLVSNDAYSLSGGSFDERHLMTIAPSGVARYTLHQAAGPSAITYLGTCKAQN